MFVYRRILLERVRKSSSRLFSRCNNHCSDKEPSDNDATLRTVLSKYEPFRDDRSPIILDVEEERKKSKHLAAQEEQEDDYNEFHGIRPEPGIEGVLDLEELVDVLKRQSAQDLFVVKVPEEFRYVQHMVIVSGKSARHMFGMAEFIRKVYKYKMGDKDIIPTIEGKGSRDWIALDLGNIALHIFSKTKRLEYDLESLWSVGKDHDRISNLPDDPVVQLLKEHSVYIGELSDNTNK